MSARGWTERENEMLMNFVEERRSSGGSLSEAFRLTAESTGRMPNSVRNHYYSLSSPEGAARSGYVPFTDEEARELVDKMLELTAKGNSVRRAALTLAKGDAGLMLRYQNKFRSMREKSPELFGKATGTSRREKSPVTEPKKADADKRRDLMNERFLMLHAMFTRLLELNSELTRELAEASDDDKNASPCR